METYLIQYKISSIDPQWDVRVGEMIAAVKDDPAFQGKVSYRALKKDDQLTYVHIGSFTDEAILGEFQARDYMQDFRNSLAARLDGSIQVTECRQLGSADLLPR